VVACGLKELQGLTDAFLPPAKTGTDVAKEAADVVLAKDDFQSLSHAIAEGKGAL
jgi:magnesium-transporting ATPase (P-type)